MHSKFLSMTRRLFVICALLHIYPAVLGQETVVEEIDRYIETVRSNWETPGFAVAIVKNDTVIFAKGYGVRQLGKPDKVDEYTLFAVASNTKAFTAALLGMLVEEGKLHWDDPAMQYLPNFAMYDPYVSREITIRDLLAHRSGLPVFGGDHLWIGGDYSRDEIIHRLRYLQPNAPFRAKYQYNNLLFLVAGEIYPAVTGESWDEAIQRRIFDPLGMKDSNITIRRLAERGNVAAPHEMVAGKVTPIPYDFLDNIAPAGALNSNVMDMARWMRLNLNAGLFEGKQILSEKVIHEMQSIVMPTPISQFNEQVVGIKFSGYGLGWGIINYRDRKVVTHSGGMSGMISLQTLIPEEKLGIMVVTNFAPNSLPWALTYYILDRFFDAANPVKKDWSQIYRERAKEIKENAEKHEAELQAKRVPNTSPSLEPGAYAGKYRDDFSGDAEVRLENDKLVFDYNPRHIGDLEHWHYNTFRVTWRNPIFDMPPRSFLTFYLDDEGKVEKLKVTFYDPLFFQKVEETE